MNIKTLKDIPPWEWPPNADNIILEVLSAEQAADSDRLVAAELAGDATVVNDELAVALPFALGSGSEPDHLRGQAATSLGPALEYPSIEDFEDPEDVPITESMFNRIQGTLYQLFMDDRAPKFVRRRILEASVRAPQDWHQNAVRDAYNGEDQAWKLTAVFCMQYLRGFDKQILESLSSKNPDILYEAVCGAGNWEIDAAWTPIAALIASEKTEKDLLLAAIDSAALIRPNQASEILGHLLDSEDVDIADAAYESLGMADGLWDLNDDEDAPTLH